jgi:FKBP-type peptidyl-prolyl cis-trans isomerase SlyD
VSIGPDCHVTISYTLSGEGVGTPEEVQNGVTVSYVHGYGQILPAIERALAGKTEGAHVSIIAEPEDAFGLHEPDGIFEIDKEGLPGADEVEVGEEVVATGPDGDILMRIMEIRPETILVDTNHPLAGKRVSFEVDVVSVRPASEEEIEESQAALEEEHASDCGCGQDHLVPMGSKRPA